MRSSVLLSALILVISAGVREARACQCMSPGPPCQNFFQSDVVFVGTVRSITPVASADVLERLRVEFEDAASGRGVEGTSMTVYTSDGGGSCGFPFKRGERYVVYADRIANRIVATTCSRTRHVADGGTTGAPMRQPDLSASGRVRAASVPAAAQTEPAAAWEREAESG